MQTATEKKKKEITDDVMFMIHFSECPRCHSSITMKAHYLGDEGEPDAVVDSCELTCDSEKCGYSVGFGGPSSSQESSSH